MFAALPMLVLVLFLLTGVPIAVALAGSGMLGIWLVTGDPAKVMNIIGLAPFSSVADYALTTIPMFILMAFFSASSGLARDLYNAAAAWLSHVRGGLAIATTFMLAFFTTLGSGVTILSLGGLMLPLLTKAKYPEKTSIGLVAVGGSTGLLFPPSLPVILYAIKAGIPIDELYLGGLFPGLLMVAAVAAFARFFKFGA